MNKVLGGKLYEFCFDNCPYRNTYIHKIDVSTYAQRNIIETIKCENEVLCQVWSAYKKEKGGE